MKNDYSGGGEKRTDGCVKRLICGVVPGRYGMSRTIYEQPIVTETHRCESVLEGTGMAEYRRDGENAASVDIAKAPFFQDQGQTFAEGIRGIEARGDHDFAEGVNVPVFSLDSSGAQSAYRVGAGSVSGSCLGTGQYH